MIIWKRGLPIREPRIVAARYVLNIYEYKNKFWHSAWKNRLFCKRDEPFWIKFAKETHNLSFLFEKIWHLLNRIRDVRFCSCILQKNRPLWQKRPTILNWICKRDPPFLIFFWKRGLREPTNRCRHICVECIWIQKQRLNLTLGWNQTSTRYTLNHKPSNSTFYTLKPTPSNSTP